MPTRDQILLHLNVEIEKLERRLKGFEVPLLPGQQRHKGAFERMIERKKVLEAERERLLGTSPANNARPVTQAPLPITPLRGSWISPGPERTQTPSDLPPYYPNDLIPETRVIIAEAVREFADQTRTLELCKHVISSLTPLFRKAVESGTLQAETALSNSGMGGLLHCLLVHNCDNENERFRLQQEVMASDEWLMLAREIEEVSAELKVSTVERKSGNHRTMVKAYIEEVRVKKSKRITRKDIWTAAGYQTRTEFERWERQDPKNPNQAANKIFTRILCVEKPHLK